MKKRSRDSLSFEMTPLIDVVFLLLIFFMVSTVFKKDELALLLSLPEASKGDGVSQDKRLVVIELSEENIAYNGTKLELDDLNSKLETIEDKKTPVDLRIDKNVRYERIVQVLDKLKVQKLFNLTLVTKSQSSE
ncbi:MAG: biopolymer transporter ExbD [Bdellovibrio sp.]